MAEADISKDQPYVTIYTTSPWNLGLLDMIITQLSSELCVLNPHVGCTASLLGCWAGLPRRGQLYLPPFPPSPIKGSKMSKLLLGLHRHLLCPLGQCHHDKSQEWTREMLAAVTLAQAFCPCLSVVGHSYQLNLSTAALRRGRPCHELRRWQGQAAPPDLLAHSLWLFSPTPAYQEGTEHVEADEVEDGEAAATGRLPFCAVVGLRLRGALLPWHAGQHDVLPCLPSGTPGAERQENRTPMDSSPISGPFPGPLQHSIITIVTMCHIRSSDLIHLKIEGLYPFTNFFLFLSWKPFLHSLFLCV